jgi:hypothetical protein
LTFKSKVVFYPFSSLEDYNMSEAVTFPNGAQVRTTLANLSMREEWTERAWEQKRWGVVGTVIDEHNGHGLCYEVLHEDGTKAAYDPTELELI